MSIFSIKILALITMLIDHIGEFFPHIPYVIFLRQIGRISAPLFLFVSAVGMRHSSSPKKYIKRLYLLSLIMGLGNSIITIIFPNNPVELTNNFPATIFIIACIAFIYMTRERGENWGKYTKKFIFIQLLSLPLILIIENYLPPQISYAVYGIYPNIFTCEGGIFFVFMGLLLFMYCDDRKSLSIAYSALCAFYLLSEVIAIIIAKMPLTTLFASDVQWMMIFSLDFMLLYNGKKGSSNKFSKYLFYIFYPAHIWFLYIISNFM